MEKLEYLNKYRKDVTIITEINEQVKAAIPGAWIDVLGTEDMQERIRKMLSIWRDALYTELPNTFSYLEQNVKTLDFIIIQADQESYPLAG